MCVKNAYFMTKLRRISMTWLADSEQIFKHFKKLISTQIHGFHFNTLLLNNVRHFYQMFHHVPLIDDTLHSIRATHREFFWKWPNIPINHVWNKNMCSIVKNKHLHCSNICSTATSQLAKLFRKIPIIFSIWHYWYILKLSYLLSMFHILDAN